LAEGYPFIFGFSIYSSFTDHEGDLQVVTPMPSGGDKVIGLHAAMAVGYDDNRNLFIIRNSWGPGEGENGYFYMPYAYLTDDSYSSDFWTIRLISD
jgi:C1A family cysteine protease